MTKKMKLGMIMLATLVVGSSVYAAKGDAGSSNDPLVTKSYVDSKVTQLQKTVEVQASMIDLLTQEINNNKEQRLLYALEMDRFLQVMVVAFKI